MKSKKDKKEKDKVIEKSTKKEFDKVLKTLLNAPPESKEKET